MHERDRHRAFADAARHPLNRAYAAIARGKNPRAGSLQVIGHPIQVPVGAHGVSGKDKTVAVEGDRFLKEASIGVCANKDEKSVAGD